MGNLYGEIADKLSVCVGDWNEYPLLEGDSPQEGGVNGIFQEIDGPYSEKMPVVAAAADKFGLGSGEVHELIKMTMNDHFSKNKTSKKSIELSYLTWCEIFRMEPGKGYLNELLKLSKK